jgi:hypothetical protein
MTGSSDIPAWISSIGGSISLVLAFYIILRDRKKDDRRQAVGISAWQYAPNTYHVITESTNPDEPLITVDEVRILVHNSSNMPVTNLTLLERTMTSKELRALFAGQMVQRGIPEKLSFMFHDGSLVGDDGKIINILYPDAKAHQTETTASTRIPASIRYPLNAYRRWVYFTDTAGTAWLRDVSTGKLLMANSMRTRRIVRGALLPYPSFELHLRRIMGESGPPSLVTRQAILISRFSRYICHLARKPNPFSKP